MLFELTSAFSAPARYDVCIIGAGAAGITVARRLAQTGHNVLLAEAGGLEYSDRSQAIYQGEVIGDPYFELDQARLRYFGGTTNHWAGVCRPLDQRDFRPKPYVTSAGWPIELDDLAHARDSRGEPEIGRRHEAAALFEQITADDTYVEFLTLPAYQQID